MLWISGDTVLYDGVRRGRRPARRSDTALLHLGGGAVPGHRAGALHDDRPGGRRAVPAAAARARRSRCTTRAGRTSGRAATRSRRRSRPPRRTSGGRCAG